MDAGGSDNFTNLFSIFDFNLMPTIKFSILLLFFTIGSTYAQTLPATIPANSNISSEPGPTKGFQYLACHKKQGACTSKPTIEMEYRDADEKAKFIDTNPSKRFSAITLTSVDNLSITIGLISREYFIEYSGPIVNTVRKDIYEARPICAAIGHTFTLGIGFLLNPIDSMQNALGCTDETIIKKEVDGPRSIKTGEGVWKESPTKQIFIVSGFSRDYEYELDWKIGEVSKIIDLKNIIDSENLEAPTNLIIKCKTCNSLSSLEQSQLSFLNNIEPIVYDFRPIKIERKETADKLFAEQKAEASKRAEDVARQVEDYARAFRDEADRIDREGDGSEEDLICQKRKLKPSTNLYLKCIASVVAKREKDEAAKLAADEKKRIAIDALEAKQLAVWRETEERKQKQEAARMARNSPVNQNEFSGDGRLSLDVSKKKCSDLGFKPATEGFGKCVLQLSK